MYKTQLFAKCLFPTLNIRQEKRKFFINMHTTILLQYYYQRFKVLTYIVLRRNNYSVRSIGIKGNINSRLTRNANKSCSFYLYNDL